MRDGAGFLVPPAILGLVAERRLRPAALFIALLCGYSVYVGGDAFKNGRFLLAGLPPLTALALSGVERGFGLRHEIGLALGWFAVAALLWPLYGAGSTPALTLAAIVLATRIPAVTARFRWATPGALGGGAIALGALFLNGPTDAGGRELGPLHSARRTAAPPRSLLTDKYVAKQARLVRRAHPPATLVAHTAIGRFGYYSRLRILDVFGLVDAHVARSDSALARAGRGGLLLPGHQRSDSDYVLSREPDFIFIPRRVPALRAHQVPAVLDLWDNPRFKRNYAYEPGVGAYRRRASTPPDRASSP